MSETFEELYASLLKEVFTTHARQQLEQGADGLVAARTYAEQGKPEFALAFLLLIDGAEEEELLVGVADRRRRRAGAGGNHRRGGAHRRQHVHVLL